MNLMRHQHAKYFWLLLISTGVLLYVAYANQQSAYFSLFVILAGIFASSFLITLRNLRNIGLVLSSIGVCVFVVEAALGFIVDSNPKTRYEGDYVADDLLKKYFGMSDFGFRPNTGVYTSKKFASTGDLIYDVVYTIEDDRTRVTLSSPEYLRQHPEGINFFGGSFTFGEGLNDSETLPYYVSQLLHAPAKNYGAHGYGAHQAYYIMRNHKLSTENSINVFITSAFHSQRSYCIPSYSRGSPRYVINNTGHGDAVVQDGVCADPFLGDKLPDIIIKVLSKFNIYSLVKEAAIATRDRDEEFKLYIQLIRSMHDISESQNRGFIVGYIDAEKQYFKGSDYNNQRIVSLLKEDGIKVVDITLAENGKLSRQYYIHNEDKHPTAIANQTRAQLLASELAVRLQ